MSDSDSWQTPDWLFEELNEEFNFDIDLCATAENSKCDKLGIDYLSDIYSLKDGTQTYGTKDQFESVSLLKGEAAFMNPPYSNPKPFIEKAWEDSKHCKIVCLVKCDPSTKWWSTFWYYDVPLYICGDGYNVWEQFDEPRHGLILLNTKSYNGPKPGCEVRFFPKRIKFDPPKGYDMTRKYSSPAFGCALVIMDRRGL